MHSLPVAPPFRAGNKMQKIRALALFERGLKPFYVLFLVPALKGGATPEGRGNS